MAGLERQVASEVRALAERLAQQSGALAVLFYGSNLRTGSLDGVLDFYLLLPGCQHERIWPRVGYHEIAIEGQVLRVKTAALAFATFARAAAGSSRDTTIWARFVQPAALAWVRDEVAAQWVAGAVADAARTAGRLAAALGPERGTQTEYWRALFRATYAAELRVEKPGREDDILSRNADHFDGLLLLTLDAEGIAYQRQGDMLEIALPPARRRAILRWWRWRRMLGKPLNIARLLKASATFENAAAYGAWKIERHTGMAVELTPWRERHPVLAAPGVFWRLWRHRRAGKSNTR